MVWTVILSCMSSLAHSSRINVADKLGRLLLQEFWAWPICDQGDHLLPSLLWQTPSQGRLPLLAPTNRLRTGSLKSHQAMSSAMCLPMWTPRFRNSNNRELLQELEVLGKKTRKRKAAPIQSTRTFPQTRNDAWSPGLVSRCAASCGIACLFVACTKMHAG